MSKYTDWFPPWVKPVYVGWYQCKCCHEKVFWTGERWVDSFPEVEDGLGFIIDGWRGLKEKAE